MRVELWLIASPRQKTVMVVESCDRPRRLPRLIIAVDLSGLPATGVDGMGEKTQQVC